MRTISVTQRSWRPWLGQVAMAGSRRARLGDIQDLNDSTFSQILSAQAAVVDFWSPTCLPCLRYKPTFLEVAGQVQNVTFATVNADESADTMAKYGIQSIPATLFFLNGTLVSQTSGPMTKEDLTAAIRNMMIAPVGTTPPAPPPPDQVTPQTQGPVTPPPDQTAAPAPTPAPAPAPSPPPAASQTPKPTQPSNPSTQAPASSPAPAGAAPADSGMLKTILLVGGVGILAVGAITLLAGGR